MEEKHLLETAGIGIDDWEKTPVSVRKLVVQLGWKIEQLEQRLKELQVSNQELNEKVNSLLTELPLLPLLRFSQPPQKEEKKEKRKKAGRTTGSSGS